MFLIPTLSKGKCWVIDCKVVCGDTETRVRKKFNLNEIKNLEVRQEVADSICNFLKTFDYTDYLPSHNIEEAKPVVTLRMKFEERDRDYDRKNTTKTYKTAVDKFVTWATEKGYYDKNYLDFTEKQGREYISFLKKTKFVGAKGVLKPYAPRTVNNNLTLIRTVFSEILKRDKSIPNPFSEEKKLRVVGKNRRPFTDQERIAVAKFISEKDYWLFRGVLLQYFCYIRPKEISSLKFKDFDLAKGLVKISVFEAKSWVERYATIPESIMHYFRDGIFDRQPANFYMFGKVGDGSRRAEHKMAPAKIPARDDRPYKKHKAYLNKLKKLGALRDIDGLCWYSWKDTGISNHIHDASPLSTKDQAGHSEMEMTLIYYKKNEVNEEYRKLKNDLFG